MSTITELIADLHAAIVVRDWPDAEALVAQIQEAWRLPAPEIRWGPWTSKLIQWCNDAAMGDNGEKPEVEITWDGSWWDITCVSFYDGHADARAKQLEDAAKEAVERLTTHPERQRDSEIRSAAYALARLIGIGHAEAEEIVRGAIVTYSRPNKRL